MDILNSIFCLVRCVVIAFLITYASTFGWKFWSVRPVVSPESGTLREDLKEHVRILAHEIGVRDMRNYDNLLRAQDYIYGQFKKYGYDVELQSYIIDGKEVNNVIARQTTAPEEVTGTLVVGAHYDTFHNPGADDNASGVAGMLEIAKALSGAETEHPVVFVAFVNEEPPFFRTEKMGSRVFVRDMKARGKKIETAIILESVGYFSDDLFSQRYPPVMGFLYPNRANFVILAGNRDSREHMNRFFTSFSRHSDFPLERVPPFDFIPGIDYSDHWSFWQDGYSAFMITGTAFLRNEHYHKSTDTYEKLNYGYLAEVTRGTIKAIKNY